MSEVKSLAAKMAMIMGEVPTMIKNGQNVQQKYAYVTAEDVKASLRPLLKKHKVAVFSSMVGVDRKEGTTKNGGASMTTVAHMRFVLVCGETGEQMECEWFGESTDYGDKSVNKAATAAEKYWLINTFMLSTSEPDADEETIELVPDVATTEQRRVILSMCRQLWHDGAESEVPKSLAQRYKKRTTKELTHAEAEDFKDWLVDQISREPQPA